MPENITTQLVVLGGGPGGYAAAFLAAERGLKTTLIDAAPKPGGACLHVGCIPSKTLLHAAGVVTTARDAAAFGIKFARPEIDLATLRAKGNKIVDTHASHLLELCKKRGVTHVEGRGIFTGPKLIEVDDGPEVTFDHCIVATGSSPTKLPTLSLDSPRVMDSTAALALESVPATLLVVGGGYIGLELGTVYAALGSKVTCVELTGNLLPGVDVDLVRPLANRLKSQFDKIHLSTKVTKIAEAKGGIRATLEGEGAGDLVFEKVLVAVGRRPNSAGFGLDQAGVEVTDKGFVKVDEQRRTSNPHIFAIGDVAGEPMLAHKAAHEGKLAVQVIMGEPMVWEPRAIPAVVFTDPEIAWAGLTETEAAKENREVRVARFHWAASGRASTLGRSDGLTKILVEPKSDQVLGVGLCGPGAGELISEAVVAIEMGATSKDLALCIHPHPTLTETISEAAETLHGLSSHIYVQKKRIL
ncbi:MAG: dihydrolipoyl dehydrogenase [Gemmataceae bacterium]|nr:dihydrolipoyl dehydrogenase [Gemmataceae bacterium]MCI0743451.1 dihydrolipoyl dehydrogenase [Gemmataceae bacterium]